MAQMTEAPTLSVAEVAARYGVSEWTVYEWARHGRIPHFKPRGSSRLIIRADWLDQWENGDELDSRDLGGGGRSVRPKRRKAA